MGEPRYYYINDRTRYQISVPNFAGGGPSVLSVTIPIADPDYAIPGVPMHFEIHRVTAAQASILSILARADCTCYTCGGSGQESRESVDFVAKWLLASVIESLPGVRDSRLHIVPSQGGYITDSPAQLAQERFRAHLRSLQSTGDAIATSPNDWPERVRWFFTEEDVIVEA